MANGDVAALYGFTPIAATDDLRLGYDRINQLADLLMARTGTNAWSLAAISAAANWGTITDPNGASSGTLGGGVKVAGQLLLGSFQITYTGSTAITAGTTGNIGDTSVCTLASGYRPSARRYFAFHNNGVAIGSARMESTGLIQIVSLDPNASISNSANSTISCEFVVPV